LISFLGNIVIKVFLILKTIFLKLSRAFLRTILNFVPI
jgi:hypothetical protein